MMSAAERPKRAVRRSVTTEFGNVVSKRLCKKLDKQSKADNITEYRRKILPSHRQIKDAP